MNSLSKILNEIIKTEHKHLLFEELSLLIEKEIKIGDNLKRKLKNINKPFADKLLQYLSSDKLPDRVQLDSIDVTPKDDKTLTGFYIDREGNQREKQYKVGKLLDYLNIPINDFKGYEIQELISYLKKGSTEDFKIVDGEDILWAYHCNNYDEGESMGSCMRYEAAQQYLGIYTDNPDDIKCLVLVNPNNNKVRGRALLFNMDNGQTYMDRVYVINAEYRHLFNQYAEENGYLRKPKSTVTLYNGGEYEYYPYMDTFMFYNPTDGVLSTGAENSDYIKLQDTHGGNTPAGVELGYGSSEGEYVDEDEAYFISYRYDGHYYEGYVLWEDIIMVDDEAYLIEHTVRLTNGDDVFLGNDDFVQLGAGSRENEYAHIDDAVYLNDYHYDGVWVLYVDAIDCDEEFYDDVWFLEEDTVLTHNNARVYKDDVVDLYTDHYGSNKIAHVDEITRVKIKGFGFTYVLTDDVQAFKEDNLIESQFKIGTILFN